MGHRKRKRGTPKLDGGRTRASSDKPKPSDGDLEREEKEDSDQMGIISADSGEARADSDQLMKETQVIHDGDLLDEEGKGRTVYLVACHWDWSMCTTPYSVYKMDLAPSNASSSSSAKARLLNAAGSLHTLAGGKSFISLRSRHRSWIVGVGGDSGDVIIFDTKSPDPAQAVIHGPNLMSAKWCPVLTTVGDRIFALCKKPSWKLDPDFPPWFEVLDVSQARVVSDGHLQHLKGCSWSRLPIPPCIPWKLSPTDYTCLPITILMSYVLVAPYILVSYNQPWGTYAFDTNSDKWHKVDDNPLPFFGCASRHGPIFLASSKKDGPINAYCIRLTTSDEGHALKLSITALPVEYEEHEVKAGPCCFASLDNEHFCLLSFELDSRGVMLHPDSIEPYPTKAYLSLRTYQIKPSLLETPEETLLAVKSVVAISSKLEHRFKIRDVCHGVTPLASTLLSIRGLHAIKHLQ